MLLGVVGPRSSSEPGEAMNSESKLRVGLLSVWFSQQLDASNVLPITTSFHLESMTAEDPPSLRLALEPLYLGDYGSLVHDVVDNKPVFEE